MNAVLPYHKGVLLQKGRGIGGVFSSLFRTLLPIGKTVLKSSPKIIKNTARSPLGRKLRKSAKKLEFGKHFDSVLLYCIEWRYLLLM